MLGAFAPLAAWRWVTTRRAEICPSCRAPASGFAAAAPPKPALASPISSGSVGSRRAGRWDFSRAIVSTRSEPAMRMATKCNLATSRCLQPMSKRRLGGATSAGFPLVAEREWSRRCRSRYPPSRSRGQIGQKSARAKSIPRQFAWAQSRKRPVTNARASWPR